MSYGRLVHTYQNYISKNKAFAHSSSYKKERKKSNYKQSFPFPKQVG